MQRVKDIAVIFRQQRLTRLFFFDFIFMHQVYYHVSNCIRTFKNLISVEVFTSVYVDRVIGVCIFKFS